ncbi:cyclin-like protein [Nitzschia inconspicua]|uniref:Cyclin-like protein n=1 Tax=Nitzschia inconspicua TaxID=303405 RepID=A0A9K3PZK4_9STRA|nr:cyclin-like protein [Nitzschia inconspicua]
MNVQHRTAMVVTPIPNPSFRDASVSANDSSLDLSEYQQPSQDPVANAVRNSIALLLPPTPMGSDKIQAMLSMEATRYESPKDYLLKIGSRQTLNGYATETWRRRLCEWMFEVADHFGFDREVVSISSYIMDRMASLSYDEAKSNHATKRQFQLDAVASLYLSLKVHGEMDPDLVEERIMLGLSTFVELSRGFFSGEVIVAKETEILHALKWHINPPTCSQFLWHYLQLLPAWTVEENNNTDIDHEDAGSEEDVLATRQIIWIKVFDVAKYLTELSVFISDFAFNYKPSTISYAALLCALEYVQDRTPFPRRAHAQLLDNLSCISSKFAPHLDDIQHLQNKLKRLAPDFFPVPTTLTRTVSLSDVESANSVAAASPGGNSNNNKRTITPVHENSLDARGEPPRKQSRRTPPFGSS